MMNKFENLQFEGKLHKIAILPNHIKFHLIVEPTHILISLFLNEWVISNLYKLHSVIVFESGIAKLFFILSYLPLNVILPLVAFLIPLSSLSSFFQIWNLFILWRDSTFEVGLSISEFKVLFIYG